MTNMSQEAIDGKWPFVIKVESFCGEGENRHIYHKDDLTLHGGVDALRIFAMSILAALPADKVAESTQVSA